MAEFIDVYVECASCGKHTRCAKMNDGTVYRPFAWVFPYRDEYLGLCVDCKGTTLQSGTPPVDR